MELGNPRIELEIQGHRYNQYYCGLFCPAAQWCGLVPGQVEKKEKQKSRWRSAQSVDTCSSKHLNKKIQELDPKLCASIIHAAAPDVPKEILQMCGTAVDLIEI